MSLSLVGLSLRGINQCRVCIGSADFGASIPGERHMSCCNDRHLSGTQRMPHGRSFSRPSVILAAMLVLVGTPAMSAVPDVDSERAACRQSAAESQVRNCTAAIEASRYQGTDLAELYMNRANARDALGDKKNALDDYIRAFR